jgi:ribonuclease D
VRPDAPQPEDLQWIDTPRGLDDLIGQLIDAPRYGLDTEFLRTSAEAPEVALVQVAWADGVALIDPVAVDLAPFGAVLRGPGLLIGHALEQDLEIIEAVFGHPPADIFDTQVAALFAGFGQAGLSRLVKALFDEPLPKGARRSDWFRRPLSAYQRLYAARDVTYLLDLQDALTDRLIDLGRVEWVIEDCDRLRREGHSRKGPRFGKVDDAVRDAVRARAAELDLPGHVLASNADLAWWAVGEPPPHLQRGWRVEILADILGRPGPPPLGGPPEDSPED